jgi:biopolymer transport protein ExbB/TolQ
MWPIVAMSLVVVTFGIERLVALRRRKFVPPELARELADLEEGRFDPRLAYRLCADHPSVAARVVQGLLEKTGRPLPELERAVEVEQDREASRLYANVRPISLAVSVTPLLGLLGTVQGMIMAFMGAVVMGILRMAVMALIAVIMRLEAGALTEIQTADALGLQQPQSRGIARERLERIGQPRRQFGPDPNHQIGRLQRSRLGGA